MAKITHLGLLAALSAAFLLTGCDKPPVQEMENAKQAVESARKAEAEKYAVPEFKTLNDSLKAAQAEVDRQNARFALLRNYDQSKKTLAWVDTQSDKVAETSRENKEKMRKQTEAMIEAASVAVDTARVMVARAPKGKESQEEIKMFETELAGMSTALQDVKASMAKENFPETQRNAKAVQTKADDLKNQVQAAIDRYQELKAKRKGGKKK
jgi:uncharacterized coiled-coil DUF342 family protein